MRLKEVKGIIIDSYGQEHSFGKYGTDGSTEHDVDFKKEILPSTWFQDLHYAYDKEKSLYRQIMDMTAYGLTFILNGSSNNKNGGEYKLYTIQCPLHLTQEVKEYFEKNYTYLKELMEEEGTWFQGEPYENGEYVWNQSAYQIDEFYDKMDIAKMEQKKH